MGQRASTIAGEVHAGREDEHGSGSGATAANATAGVTDTTFASASLAELFAIEKTLQLKRQELRQRAREVLRDIAPVAKLTKACSVNGRAVLVVDGAIPETVRQHLFESLETDSFKRTEFARPDTRDYRHHIVDYNLDKLKRTQLFALVGRLVDAFFPAGAGQMPLEAYRIYTNAVMFGDVAFPHRDSDDDDSVTALFYPNPEWVPEYGGETIFYDDTGEIADAVAPAPGRLCIFHGCIQHKGSPPSRLFWGGRYTTAIKFQRACGTSPITGMR